MSKIPPEQYMLHTLNEMELAEEIERHIEFVDKKGRSVHPPMQYVRQYQQRQDEALPTAVAVATLPIVLADGGLLAMHEGLDRERGIVFKIPQELVALLPSRDECTSGAVGAAMRFLMEEWLCDVLTDDIGKCVLIAAALTIIERSLLNERPAFFVTAGRRGSGKTTTLSMIITAVTGLPPAAAAWSTNEEERRKALLSYFLAGVPYIIWDNIKRGSQISCPHIERSCTVAYYADRKLGVSETIAAAASTIHCFTGNNISPSGDLASRSLHARLAADRTDPENRKFIHPDAMGWTEANRGEILRALYTVLLGNPQLEKPRDAPAKTRFKMWWRLVGSAIEHAHAEMLKSSRDKSAVNFEALFQAQEEDDEESTSLAEMLNALRRSRELHEKEEFKAADVAAMVNAEYGGELRELLFSDMPQTSIHSAKATAKRLALHVDMPVRSGADILTLRKRPTKNGLLYWIQVTAADQ